MNSRTAKQSRDARPPRRPHASSRPPVAALVSLGCAKNTVDSERLLAQLVQDGFLIAEDPAVADVCLVNTCGFIESAREETAQTLGQLARARAEGHPRFIVALGCLVERATQVPEFAEFLRHADALIGFGDYLNLASRCRALVSGTAPAAAPGIAAPPAELDPSFHRLPRVLTGASHSVALKISEGCSHACRFCSIPRIRGPQISRPVEDIVAEAHDVVRSGARELLLIGQDTTSYGLDLYGRRCLETLMAALTASLPARVWLRLMYAYPRYLSNAILDAMAADERWQPYLDIPLQHISTPMLQRMGRGMTGPETRALIESLASHPRQPALRTAFITGHPGETQQDFDELMNFVREGHFMHVGVFSYSPETGTPAASQSDPVPSQVAEERRSRLLAAQKEVSRKRLAAHVGETVEIMVDGPASSRPNPPAGVRLAGRSGRQAPEVDGLTWLRGKKTGGIEPGALVRARIVDSLDYDWIAEIENA